jgi:hypothetical protein
MKIVSWVRKRLAIGGSEVNIVLHQSINNNTTRARRSWMYFSWEMKKPSKVEETSIPRK